jgi:shikimate 5-dehydrogenase
MTTKPSSSRRKFLATLGAGGAAAAAVALTQQGVQSGPAASDQTPAREGKGYQLTEHVRNYYRTAKV